MASAISANENTLMTSGGRENCSLVSVSLMLLTMPMAAKGISIWMVADVATDASAVRFPRNHLWASQP